MQEPEDIPDKDIVHRHVDYPRTYERERALILDTIFEFPKGDHESVVWGKYAPSPEFVHNLGLEREKQKRQVKPGFTYEGYCSADVGAVRAIQVSRHGFSVVHDPVEGKQHAAISYQFGPDIGTKGEMKNIKNELKMLLRGVFSRFTPCPDALRS